MAIDFDRVRLRLFGQNIMEQLEPERKDIVVTEATMIFEVRDGEGHVGYSSFSSADTPWMRIGLLFPEAMSVILAMLAGERGK